MTNISITGESQEPDAQGEFDQYFRRTYPLMRTRAILLAWDREEAEDAVQDTFVELLCNWNHVTTTFDSVDAWVHTVMVRKLGRAYKDFRTRWEWRGTPAPVADLDQTVRVRQVLDALGHLPARQRQVLVMCCLLGMPQQEVADQLDIRRSTVAVTLRKARAKLARRTGIDLDDRAEGGAGLMPAPQPTAAAPHPRPAVERDPLIALLQTTEKRLTESGGPDATQLTELLGAVRRRAQDSGQEPTAGDHR